MLAADMSTDSAYMLTRGSVIYNDILAPFRRRHPWSERRGLLVNRMIVACIGVLLFFLGLSFELRGSVLGYLWKTGEISLTSMLVLLIGCVYRPRANDWGANGAIAMGAGIPVVTMILQIAFPETPPAGAFALAHGDLLGLAAFAGAAVGMIVGSLLKPVRPVA